MTGLLLLLWHHRLSASIAIPMEALPKTSSARFAARSVAVILASVACELFTGCAGSPDITIDGGRLHYPGFETFPTPRTFDSPGTLYRLDPDGQRVYAESLVADVPDAGSEAFATASTKGGMSIATGLSLLRASVNGDVDLQREYEVTVTLGPGHRQRIGDIRLATALAGYPRSAIRFDAQYYVIKETISVDSIDYSFEDSVSANAGLAATVKSATAAPSGAGDISLSAGYHDNKLSALKATFKNPHRVFYCLDRVQFAADGSATVRAADPSVIAAIAKARAESERNSYEVYLVVHMGPRFAYKHEHYGLRVEASGAMTAATSDDNGFRARWATGSTHEILIGNGPIVPGAKMSVAVTGVHKMPGIELDPDWSATYEIKFVKDGKAVMSGATNVHDSTQSNRRFPFVVDAPK